jgi:hypothetical protein
MILELLFLAKIATASGSAPNLELTSLELTALSKTRSEGRAAFALTNRDTADLSDVVGTCVVRVNGQEVGSGTGARKKVRSGKRVFFEIVFRVDYDGFKKAAGGKWVEGAWVDSEVEGTLTAHRPSGDANVPFKFAEKMGTDGAREGVFAPAWGR